MPAGSEDYATYEECVAEGLPAAVDEVRCKILLDRANELIESITRNFFRKIISTFTFDGSNSHILFLPNPIITVTSLKINNSTVALDTDYYRVWNGRARPTDDRKNPKIELRNVAATSSIYTLGISDQVFYKGMDQVIAGTFGYLESDDSVPRVVNESAIALVMTMAETLYPQFYGRMGQVVGPIVRERTDDHELEWRTSVRDIPNYIVPKYIEDRLMLVRAPLAAAVPELRNAGEIGLG
ncbi:MAG: hypothetical protein KAS32_19700 [Candidatus Peribacteraceae bacterium]|nr:hypothetical protein [Candidatus Peribacteraceae bacterium]